MIHNQVIAKVNCPVDVAVKPLVDAMNSFPDVITWDSCGGNADGEAYVAFYMVESRRFGLLSRFTNKLAERLGTFDRTLGDVARWRISLEWHCGMQPTGCIRIASAYTLPAYPECDLPVLIQRLAGDLQEVRRNFEEEYE